MKIKAAAYGCERLIFLADSVNDTDVSGLLANLSKSGVAHVIKRDNGIHSEISLTNKEKYAGNLFIASKEGSSKIRSMTKLTLMPYIRRLIEPKFIIGEIIGERPIRKVLRQYNFSIIEAIDKENMADYSARFSDLKGIVVRVQPQQDQEMSITIGYSWLEL